MKKYIVLSVNENPEYLYYLPLTCWAWRKFGWTPIVFTSGVVPENFRVETPLVFPLKEIDGYRSDTIAQVSRLYAGAISLNGDPIIMTGDVDMIPLSDYWNPQDGDITIYGHDLTGYVHYPICYIAMNKHRWVEVMGLSGNDYDALIKRDLDTLPQARADFDPVRRWVSDQDLITKRLNETQFKKVFVSRGTLTNGYPVGRVDRSAWTIDHQQLIDCHLFRGLYEPANVKFDATLELLRKVWPNEDFTWFIDHTNKWMM